MYATITIRLPLTDVAALLLLGELEAITRLFAPVAVAQAPPAGPPTRRRE